MIGKKGWILGLCLVVGFGSGFLAAQTPEDRETLKDLTRQADNLLSRIKDLEARIGKSNPSHPETHDLAGSSSSNTAAADRPASFESSSTSTSTFSVRGYGDLGFSAPVTKSGINNSFAIGQIDLFVTSRLSNHFGFLMETILESETDNAIHIDLERVVFQYRQNKYFNVDVGRYHSSIGYYNTAYHHGTWFQTTSKRPLLFEFEDNNGLLPTHNVGVSVHGAIASGQLNLGYNLEVGNGRDYAKEQVQVVSDNNRGKSVNFAVNSRPSWAPGLELGTSLYRDQLNLNGRKIGQYIFAGYGVYRIGRLETINEFVAIRHTRKEEAGTKVTHIPGFYSQWSYRTSPSLRPYFRYEFSNPSANDPLVKFLTDNRQFQSAQVAGIRFDFAEFATLKFEARRISYRGLAAATRASVNLSFTF